MPCWYFCLSKNLSLSAHLFLSLQDGPIYFLYRHCSPLSPPSPILSPFPTSGPLFSSSLFFPFLFFFKINYRVQQASFFSFFNMLFSIKFCFYSFPSWQLRSHFMAPLSAQMSPKHAVPSNHHAQQPADLSARISWPFSALSFGTLNGHA